MTYYVFNHRLTGEQMAVEAESIADDQEVLFAGKKEDFEKSGFNESQLGGFEKQNGKLVFSATKKIQSENLKKPLAMGKDLISFIEEAKSELTRKEVKQLLAKLETGAFFRLLRQGRCNPLKQIDLDEEILELSKLLTPKENTLMALVIGQWKQSVRFIDATTAKK